MKSDRTFDPITLLIIFCLSLGWYLMMFLPELTRDILLSGLEEYQGAFTPFAFNSALFLFVTFGFIAAYFYLAPSIRKPFLRVLFSLPWPLAGAALYILILKVLPVSGNTFSGNEALNIEFWTFHGVLVPIYLVLFAWIPILVMNPITFIAVHRWIREKRKQHLIAADQEMRVMDEEPAILRKNPDFAG